MGLWVRPGHWARVKLVRLFVFVVSILHNHPVKSKTSLDLLWNFILATGPNFLFNWGKRTRGNARARQCPGSYRLRCLTSYHWTVRLRLQIRFEIYCNGRLELMSMNIDDFTINWCIWLVDAQQFVIRILRFI